MVNNTDLRVLKTRKNIRTAFINLLLVKDFKDITIQNIIDEALIGRSTFYDHYFDKYDLLNQLIDEVLIDFTDIIKDRFDLKSENDFTRFFLNMIEHYSKQRTMFLALLTVHTESVDLYDSLINILRNECSSYLDSIDFQSKSTVPKEYISRLYASTAMTSIQWCLENNEEYTPQFFIDLFNSLKLLFLQEISS